VSSNPSTEKKKKKRHHDLNQPAAHVIWLKPSDTGLLGLFAKKRNTEMNPKNKSFKQKHTQ
jgi:hypothetical protein